MLHDPPFPWAPKSALFTAIFKSVSVGPLYLMKTPAETPFSPGIARRAAEEGGFSYSIVRSGEIKGDPFVTYSPEGAVSAPAGEARVPRRMVSLRRGDTEAGDVNPSSVAATFTQVGGRNER